MKPWLEKLAKIAPAVAGAVVNPATAPAAVAAIVRAIGSDGDDDDAIDAALQSLTPEQIASLMQLNVTITAQLALGQIGVNQTEASSGDKFVSRWRPAVGWVCVIGLAYCFVLQPLLAWGTLLAGASERALPPQLDISDLLTLLAGMLGLGTLRTTEKLRGVTR